MCDVICERTLNYELKLKIMINFYLDLINLSFDSSLDYFKSDKIKHIKGTNHPKQ